MAIRFLTAGESHGPALTLIVEGLPARVVPPESARQPVRFSFGCTSSLISSLSGSGLEKWNPWP